jgi:membrane protein implicated in regulation of membrane protease activity
VKRQTPLWLLAGLLWLGTSIIVTGLVFYVSSREPGSTGKVDWLFVALLSTAVTGIVVAIVRELRARPSPMQQAALTAIFNAEDPDTIGAVVVMKNGTPEVVATVRSRDEYLELAGSGQLPEAHLVFLPDDT